MKTNIDSNAERHILLSPIPSAHPLMRMFEEQKKISFDDQPKISLKEFKRSFVYDCQQTFLQQGYTIRLCLDYYIADCPAIFMIVNSEKSFDEVQEELDDTIDSLLDGWFERETQGYYN